MCRSISSGKGVLSGWEEEVVGLEVELERVSGALEEACVGADPPGPERPIGTRPRELPSAGPGITMEGPAGG